MKLVAIDQTTLLGFGVLSRLQGQLYLPQFVDALASEFLFVEHPEVSTATLETLEFSHGLYDGFAIAKMGFYSDGIVIHSQTSSEQLDKLYSYVLKWMQDNFSLDFVPSTSAETVYRSSITFHSEKNLMKPLSALCAIEESIASLMVKRSNVHSAWSFSGYSATAVNVDNQGFKPIQFRVEHKTGSAPKLGLFFSEAPLATADHLELLGKLEDIL